MINIYGEIFLGDINDCSKAPPNLYVIHACKHPCHQVAVGYSGRLPKESPYYLFMKKDKHLYLNMVDMTCTVPSHEFMSVLFKESLDFLSEIKGKKVLIHCNKGQSRSPMIALLYLSKIEGVIPSDTYDNAKKEFVNRIYRGYNPSAGTEQYIKMYWEKL